MTKKIFQAIMLAAGAVLLASLAIIMSCLYNYFGNIQEVQMEDALALAMEAVETGGEKYLKSLDTDYRLTWVAENGAVLYDTQADEHQMENHGNREEIRQALWSGTGKSARYSNTLMEKTIYYARQLSDGTVLRISARRATAGRLALGMLQPILLVLTAALICAGILARRISRRIVEPLERLDLENPLENDTYEELAPLLGRIHQQRRQIEGQLRELRRKNDEFAQITGNMKEGLVLLNEEGVVLSINRAARQLFHTDFGCVGTSFLAVDRSREVQHAVREAMERGHSEIHMERDGKQYQLDVSRIASDGAVVGAVLLTFDVTEQTFAQRNRKEFTANVSHELKTPLQAIMGSAELMENGLVKPEDLPRFVGHIRTEAARLLVLIQDIIHLSQLDEGAELPFESVGLYEIARETLNALGPGASKRNIRLSVTGEGVKLWGVRRLVTEVIGNLCDNAVKYNVPNGSVAVILENRGESICITVKDTGIGIPAEHQSRVFERFFRVDKSHSKESGGTGLGLSIVKHAVEYMHGTIALESRPGEGTSITLTFPAHSAE